MPVMHKFGIIREGDLGLKILRERFNVHRVQGRYEEVVGMDHAGRRILSVPAEAVGQLIMHSHSEKDPGIVIYTLEREATDAEEALVERKVGEAIKAMEDRAQDILNRAHSLKISLRHVWTEDEALDE